MKQAIVRYYDMKTDFMWGLIAITYLIGLLQKVAMVHKKPLV